MKNLLRKLKLFLLSFFILNSLFLILQQKAEAHAFGQQYNLPVPFALYAYGAAIAVIASFIVIGIFVQAKKAEHYPKLDISSWFAIKFLRNHQIVWILRAISLFLFLITILTGIFGTSESVTNFNMTFFWVIAVLGITCATFLLGNIFQSLSPWKIIVDLIERGIGKLKPQIKYQRKFGYLPALLFYIIFIWIELVGRINPLELSIVLINYTVLNIIGSVVYGKEDWFEYFEFFGVFYSLLSRLSFIEQDAKKTYLRIPFSGLIRPFDEHPTIVPFIVFMLASTAFDGFKETQEWYNIAFGLHQDASLMNSLGIVGALVLFVLLYYVLTALLKFLSGSKLPMSKLLLIFAPSLLPIAFVYNIAHYYTLLLVQGQSIISEISDPLGKGWNLFGTAFFTPNIAIVDVKTVWRSQVSIIIAGHIIAVYIAHQIAVNLFGSPKKALISQLPTLILMVFYTVAGLWILAQPLTSGF